LIYLIKFILRASYKALQRGKSPFGSRIRWSRFKLGSGI